MAESLGVSRTPVREVLATLAREGLLQREGRSFTVPTPTRADMDEITEMRLLLEVPAVAAIAGKISDNELRRLRELLAAKQSANEREDWEAFILAVERFHTLLRALTGNRRLRQAIALYNDQTQFQRIRLNQPRWRVVVLNNLQALVDAFERGDATAARVVWTKHVQDADTAARDLIDEFASIDVQPLLARA